MTTTDNELKIISESCQTWSTARAVDEPYGITEHNTNVMGIINTLTHVCVDLVSENKDLKQRIVSLESLMGDGK